MNIYFASPLFSEMERNYNKSLVEKIRLHYGDSVDVYLPQENNSINDKESFADSIKIAKADTDKLSKSDLVFAVLDGLNIDNGVCAEIGYAFAKNIPVIGLYTDSRQQGSENSDKIKALSETAENQFSYINLYVVGLIKQNGKVIQDSKSAIQEIEKYIK